MAREGLVALDDPVQKHLPDGVVIPVRGRPITLADLASHTSGLPRLPKGFLRRALREGANPYASFTVEELNAAIPRTKPRRAPGRKVRYSNYGAGLLGHVLALRAGNELRGARRRADHGPARHDRHQHRGSGGEARPVRPRPRPPWQARAELGSPRLPGAGALRSTAADLLTFLDAQLGSAPPGLAEAMRATHEPRASRRAPSVGLGWMILPDRDQPGPVLWHDGGTGGFRSVAGFVAEMEASVVVLSNSARSVDRIGLDDPEGRCALIRSPVDRGGSRSSY